MSIKIILLNYNLAFIKPLIILNQMAVDFKKYYFYSHLDINKEALGVINAESMGDAVFYFSALKNMDAQEFLKIYGIGVKNEHK